MPIQEENEINARKLARQLKRIVIQLIKEKNGDDTSELKSIKNQLESILRGEPIN